MKFNYGIQKYLLIVITAMIASNAVCNDRGFNSEDILYSWLQDLTVRDEQGNEIIKIGEYESVIYLGKHSPTKESKNLRGNIFHDFRYFIKTKHGQEGWIFGGGLKKTKVTDSTFQTLAESCFYADAHADLPLIPSTKEHASIDRAVISEYIHSLQKNQLVYKRPIYESGCLGTLEEKCFASSILEKEHEGGSEIYLYNQFSPIFGIKKGTPRQQVHSILGMPSNYNDQLSQYTSSPMQQNEDIGDNISYSIRFYFDHSESVESVAIKYFYNEDC